MTNIFNIVTPLLLLAYESAYITEKQYWSFQYISSIYYNKFGNKYYFVDYLVNDWCVHSSSRSVNF